MLQPASRTAPLALALLGDDSALRRLLLVFFGSLLVAASAQISVPMWPVPMTLQTLAISIIGLTMGARLAAATMVVYLGQGAMGLPVFAGGAAGLPYMMGTTGGFLLGFVAMAWLTGFIAERGFGRGLGRLFVAAFVPALLLFLPGVLWLWAVTPLELERAIMAGAVPFQLGGLVKSALAAVIVAGGWRAFGPRRG
jgi:biotin transport system substrate-specific component